MKIVSNPELFLDFMNTLLEESKMVKVVVNDAGETKDFVGPDLYWSIKGTLLSLQLNYENALNGSVYREEGI